MRELIFEWDEQKENANVNKHGVYFEEATSAFFDGHALVFFDPDHSDDEDQFILLGLSIKLRTLVVCHCFREEEAVIRVISARKADKEEEQEYWGLRS
ncbi:MAG: BrnT family toxin [Acidobacteria bacterium]|nr:MAG: BrnT family toxin [Acidobacteriota bacterium]